ncbi:MAG: GspE/PulE family protein [Campylobacterota bacterium]|nr:GspE/PulE family protein [Campylobacterota bacterium]
MKKLEEILLENYHCTQEDLDQVYAIQEDYGGELGNILLNLGIISDTILIDSLSQQFNYRLLSSLKKEEIERIFLEGISADFLLENGLYPIFESDTSLIFVTHNPNQVHVISILKKLLKKKIELVLATDEELREIKALFEELVAEEDGLFEDEVDRLREMAAEAPVIKLVNTIFTKAAQQNASDIHFEAYKDGMKVRLRIDGTLGTIDRISLGLKQAVVARLKLMSKMNIAENRLPQDGRISLKLSAQELDIRASSVPTAFGESFVLRLLGTESVDLNLDKMGFHPENLALLKSLLTKPNGVLLTTGPTGSGKTSTLYACLNHISSEDIKIITVEDPVEYQLEGISQIQVKSSIDYTFSNALRSILRQDPDVIMIGEIRDKETAEIAIQSSLTGHFVLSTLHTNSALGAISRLLDMGIEYFLLKSTVVGLMAQRLAKRLCVECREPIDIDEELSERYDMNELKNHISSKLNPCKAVGCSACNFTGYKGRVPLIELLPFTEVIKSKLDKDLSFSDIRSLGYRNLQDDAVIKFLEGTISFDEIVRLTNE